jgi:hypothetical protein
MTRRCPSCGAANPPTSGVCAHHIATEVDWATANRVFCDLLHRRIQPPPVPIELDPSYELIAVGSTA